MKKFLVIMIGAAVMLSSCDTYEAAGAYTGSAFGNMLGSAIGGIAGGWRGHEIGSLVGTVGGAAIGAAVGKATDERRYEERAAARRQRQQRAESRRQTTNRDRGGYDQGSYNQGGYNQGYDQSGYDAQMRGDDRIDFNGGGSSNAYMGSSTGEALVIRKAGVYEEQQNGVLTRGEKCSVIFEIANTTSMPVYDVFPLVEETTRNKHIHISPNMRVESIAPHQAIRYTATLLADKGLKDGQIEVRIGVAQGNNVVNSQTRVFQVPTAKR